MNDQLTNNIYGYHLGISQDDASSVKGFIHHAVTGHNFWSFLALMLRNNNKMETPVYDLHLALV